MRISVWQQALCYSSKINRSDPGRIIFITGEAQDEAMHSLCREIINMLGACQSKNGKQVLEGTKRIVGKIIVSVFSAQEIRTT